MDPRGGIAARVNDEILTWKDVEDELRGIPPKEVSPSLRNAKRRELSTALLYRHEARRLGVAVTDRELDDELVRRAKGMGGDAELDRRLRLGGLTRTAYRQNVREDILLSKLERAMIQKAFTEFDLTSPGLLLAQVTPEELRRHFDDHPERWTAIEVVTAIRIGVPFVSAREKKEKRSVAESILRKAAEGSDPELLKHFFPEGSKSFVGWDRKRAEKVLSPEVVLLLFDRLAVGEMSGIMESDWAFEIYVVLDRVKRKARTFEKAQLDIRKELMSRRMRAVRERIKQHLIGRAYVWPKELFEEEDNDVADSLRN